MKCVPDQARLAREASDARYLTVCGDAATWNSLDRVVDAAMEALRSYCHSALSAGCQTEYKVKSEMPQLLVTSVVLVNRVWYQRAGRLLNLILIAMV